MDLTTLCLIIFTPVYCGAILYMVEIQIVKYMKKNVIPDIMGEISEDRPITHTKLSNVLRKVVGAKTQENIKLSDLKRLRKD